LLAGLGAEVETQRMNTSEWLYLARLYEVGGGQYFDVASGKPMDSPPARRPGA